MPENMRPVKLASLLIVFMLFTAHGQCDESFSTRFKVWPPETEIFKLRPGTPQPLLVGTGDEAVQFSLEEDFKGNPLGATTLLFKAPGYSSDTLQIEAAMLNTGEDFYPRSVGLSPEGNGMKLRDYARRNALLIGIVSIVLIILGFVRLDSWRKKRMTTFLSNLSGGSDWTEKAGFVLLEKLGIGATATTWRGIRKSDLNLQNLLNKVSLPT